ncbi:hypothetical protein ACO2RV_14565 [Ancylobacter sp. VNQ12]|uniref:hypothetical protein n=1 Tax=Ancylobacter sp. VNQ12 TaxID=3400920 RepID=UPI003C122D18
MTLPARTSPPDAEHDDDELQPDPPTQEDEGFELNVDMVWGSLSSIPGRHDREDIAWALNVAFDCWESARRLNSAGVELGPSQRDELLVALLAARLNVEIYLVGEERDDVVNALMALQATVVHLAKPHKHRTLPPDRVADLRDLIRLGHNAARNIGLRASLLERARKRALPTLNFAARRA